MTHSRDAVECLTPYLSSLFGIRCVSIYGRSAKRKETITSKEKALYSGWKDVLLPYMTHPQFSDDTLFLVAESDWRCYAEHIEQDLMAPILGTVIKEEPVEASNAAQSSTASSSTAENPVLHAGHLTWPGGNAQATQELKDLVSIQNQAARHNAGDLVWFGWNARWWDNDGGITPLRNWGQRFNNGSQLIGITTFAARALKAHMEDVKPLVPATLRGSGAGYVLKIKQNKFQGILTHW